MVPKVFGWQHIIYLFIFALIFVASSVYYKKHAKTEKAKNIFLKCLAGALLVSVVTNRFSVVFKTQIPEWKWLIPDSFCGMSSLMLSLAVLFGKKDNNVLHFIWLVALAGGGITTFFPNFLGQNPSFMYLPTISGLLHHTLSVLVVVMLFVSKHLNLTYKKWYCTLFGFTSYLAFGCFLMNVVGFHDAYYIKSPAISNTPFTVWVIAPIYIAVYSIILLCVELVRRKKSKQQSKGVENN